MDSNLSKLREFLLNELSEQELIALCKDIGLDYRSLAGTGAFGKTRELLIAVQARGQIPRLLRRLQELKPIPFQSAGLATLRFEVPEEHVARQPRRTSNLTAIPLIVIFALVLWAVLGLVWPREGAPQSQPGPEPAGGSDGALQATPTRAEGVPALRDGTPTATPEFADSPSPDQHMQATMTVAAPMPPAEPSPFPTPTALLPAAREDHPAAQAIRQLNEVLPRLYTGRASSSELGAYLTGGALNAVMTFNNTRLLRAMRLSPSQRASLEVSYEYINPPALVEEQPERVVVSSREFWRYANKLNGRVACEVRDYTYTLVKESERYRVIRFESQLVDNACRD